MAKWVSRVWKSGQETAHSALLTIPAAARVRVAKFSNAMPQTNEARRAASPVLKPETEHSRSHLRSVALTGSSLRDLAAVCILTRPFRLKSHELN
jgi:hypothetical protein